MAIPFLLAGAAVLAGGYGIKKGFDAKEDSMAGGMAVLGGIVAGPALAIGGAFLASKAEKALNDARSNLDQARKYDWRNYRQSDKDEIAITAQLAKTIKIIVDTSLLKENGELDDYQSQKTLNAGQKMLAKLN